MTLRPALLMLALTASSLAWGETLDPPGRIARLSYVEGQVAFQGAEATASSTLPDRPLMPGDRLLTEHGGRAEVALGSAAIRVDEQSDLSIIGLDASTVWLELHGGAASVTLRELLEDEIFEIVTPNAAISLHEPGEYRVDVAPDGATAFSVRSGSAEVETAGGPVRVAAGQRVELVGREAMASLATLPPDDAFDGWVASREQQAVDSESRYAVQYGDEYYEEELDDYGEWYDEPSYGRVWMPSYAYGGYSPFRHGQWVRVGYGWSWYDPLPWSAYTFHHGRWAYLDHLNRWCWVPRRTHHRHVAHDHRPYRSPRDDDHDGRPRDRDNRDVRPIDVPLRDRDGGITPRGPIRLSGDSRRQSNDDLRERVARKIAAHNPKVAPRSQPARETPRRASGGDRSPPRPAVSSGGGEAKVRQARAAARQESTSQSTDRSKGEVTSRPLR